MFRKRKILLLVLAASCLFSSVRADSFRNVSEKRTVKIAKIRQCTSTILLKSTKRWNGVEELTGNNDHPMITKAMNLCGLSGEKGYPWCAACMAEIHNEANLTAPHSARVVDWFKQNVIWKQNWGDKQFYVKAGMVGAIYYRSLGRYGHIVLITGEDNNNYYTLEGNTNAAGSREGQGFYKKVRSKNNIAALADYCLNGKLFIDEYESLLKRTMK